MYITALTIGIALTAAALCQPAKPLPALSTPSAQQAVLIGDKSTLLPADVAAILERPELRSATIGLYAINLKTGSPIIKYNSNRACMPASNQKLLTAAAGLQLLGPDFTWKTDISQNGTTLHITFDGDPLLTRAQLTAAINAVKTNIKEPITRIAIDDSRIQGDALGLAWQWDDIGLGFSAPVGAATIDKNVVAVTITPPATVAGTQRYEIADGILSIRANVSVEEASPANAAAPDIKNRLTITRNPLRPEVEISGTVTVGAKPTTTLVAVDNPTDAAFRIVNSILRESGIPVAANIQYARRPRQADDTLLTRITSKPLAETLPDFLKPSDNLYGELLLRSIGRIDASPATPASGVKRIQTWMTGSGIPSDGVQPADGSGLSMWNTTTAEATVALLKAMSESKAFRDALPVGGIDGTLKARFPAPEHRGKVIAKTGTLSVASCLSGYALTTKGETIIFSILMNHFDRKAGSAAARRAQDDIVRYLLSL